MEMIASFRQQGYKLGLLSNDAITLEAKLSEPYHIDQAFDAIVITAKIGVLKPDPAAYHAILQALGVRPEESIFVDDNVANVDGARAVGMVALQFHAGMELQAALEAVIAS